MNKYEKFARQLAQTICELMNLLYKENPSKQFRAELVRRLRFIKFVNGKWVLKLPAEEVKK